MLEASGEAYAKPLKMQGEAMKPKSVLAVALVKVLSIYSPLKSA
jgi:hypothetical protein